MLRFEHEEFEKVINNSYISIVDAGPLFNPIKSFKIKRNKKLKLTLTTKSNITAKSNAVKRPEGSVYKNTEIVTLKDLNNNQIILGGVDNYSWKISAKGTRTEISSINYIEANLSKKNEEKYLIEWIKNMDDSFVLSDSIKVSTKNTTSITISDITLNDSKVQIPTEEIAYILT